jgi:hypothetical protein
MKAKEGLKLLFGSVVVYVVMAACASGGPGSAGGFGSGSSEGDGSGSSGSGAPNDSGGAGILDALTDPVSEAKADTNQSGSRLKAKYYVGTDGSRQFSGWHDSMLNADCNFYPASDGSTRCMPGTPASSVFSDAGCAQRAMGVTKGCVPEAYALVVNTVNAGSTCGAYFYRVFPVGGLYSGTLYTGTPTTCTAGGTASAQPTIDYYSLGSEVALSTFVAATVQTDP